MKQFFTVDRRATLRIATPLSTGLTIQCEENHDNIDNSLHETLSRFLDGKYSKHGFHYLIDNKSMLSDPGLAMELILELIRQKDFPDKPSRLKSMFAWTSITDADKFRKREERFKNSPIFEVIPLGTDYHLADMNLLNINCTNSEFLQRCELYWSGKGGQTPFWEAVIPLPAKIGSTVKP